MTLIELMISMLILTLVCVAWLEIIGIQSAKKEARRREAVERLAGMMDAFMYEKRQSISSSTDYKEGCYCIGTRGNQLAIYPTNDVVIPMFDGDVSPIGYKVRVFAIKDKSGLKNVLSTGSLFEGDWVSKKGRIWLIGELYDVDKLFFTLPVFLSL